MRGYLEPGEEVQLRARPHEAALALPLARAVAAAAVGAGLVLLGSRVALALEVVGAAAIVAGAAVAFAAVWRWDRTQLVLTTRKLVVLSGGLRRRAAAVSLARVGPIEVDQSVVGHVLGYGTVIAGELEIPYVRQPGELCRLAR